MRSGWTRALALALLAACGEETRIELGWDASAKGMHRVGFEERSVTYVPEGMTDMRALRLAVWYPSADTTGRAAKYMGTYERPEVFLHAKPLTTGPARPLLIFSHGNLGFAEQSYFLAEYFASHGFVVAAPDHTGNTLVTLGTPLTTEIYLLRPLDVTATIDHLLQLQPPHGLAGRISDTIAVSGHSFGGYTSFAAAGATFPHTTADCTNGQAPSAWCSTMTETLAARFARGFLDARIDAVIALAPGGSAVLGPAGVSAVEAPVLLITGGMDRQTTNERDGDPYWANLDGPKDLRVDMPRAGHHSFSITCEIAPALGENDGCGSENVDWREAQHIVETYALAFSRQALFADTSVEPILRGSATISSEASLSTR